MISRRERQARTVTACRKKTSGFCFFSIYLEEIWDGRRGVLRALLPFCSFAKPGENGISCPRPHAYWSYSLVISYHTSPLLLRFLGFCTNPPRTPTPPHGRHACTHTHAPQI